MPSILIPILAFVAIVSIGGAVVVAVGSRRRTLQARLEEFGTLDVPDSAAHTGRDAGPRFNDVVEKLGSKLVGDKEAETLRQSLAHAGFFHPTASGIYVGARALATAVGLGVAALFVLPTDLSMMVKAMAVLGGGWAMSLIPTIYVDMRKRARANEVRCHLPDAVDLMEICVSAGMGLDMAWNSVTDEIRRVSPMLADEMALTNLEIHLGATRSEAMKRMAERTGSDEVSALVGTLVQSERFGTSIATALRTFADSMREQRSSRAQEAAEQVGVKMLIPMIVFILPSILIVMGGTAVIRIMEMFDM